MSLLQFQLSVALVNLVRRDGEIVSEKREVCLNLLVKDLLVSCAARDMIFNCDCCVSY